MTEYVGIEKIQANEGKKSLLYSQMELLQILKRYQNYKKLRKQELSLKKKLRKEVSEAKNLVKELENNLPKIKHESSAVKLSTGKKKRSDLQEEIDEIKRKISELQE